jgi:hypothetical protein
MNRPVPRVGAAFVLVLVVAVLAGCGGGGSPLTRVVDAANSTRALSGTGYAVTLEGQHLTRAPTDLPGGKAAYDLASGIGYVALAVNGPVKKTLYLDFVPGAVYVAPWPTPKGLLPPGKIWISVPFTGRKAPRPGDALALQLEGLSPELALDEIAWGAREASSLGTHTVNHVPMHEYAVSVDLAKALAVAKRSGRPGIAAAIASQRRAAPSGQVSADVWLTGEGHIGKIEQAIPGSKLGQTTFSFTSFHARFKRPRPPRSVTVPLASIAEPSSRALWVIATSP